MRTVSGPKLTAAVHAAGGVGMHHLVNDEYLSTFKYHSLLPNTYSVTYSGVIISVPYISSIYKRSNIHNICLCK